MVHALRVLMLGVSTGLLLAGCHAVSAPAGVSASTERDPANVDSYYQVPRLPMEAFEYPLRVGQLQLVGATQFEHNYLGFSLRYASIAHPGLRADVSIYPLVLPDDTSLADLLDSQYQAVVSDVKLAALAGQWQQADQLVEDVFQVKLPAGAEEGIHSAFVLAAMGQQYRSHLYLLARGGNYIKLNVVYPEAIDADVRPHAIARTVLTAVVPVGSAGPVQPLSVVVAEDVADARSSEAWEEYGETLAESLLHRGLLDTFERRLQAAEAAVRIARHRVEGLDPQLSRLVTAANAGFLREYVWAHFAKPYWAIPPALNLEGFTRWELSSLTPGEDQGAPVLIRWQSASRK